MTFVEIPDTVTHINDLAFCGCGLTEFVVPESVTLLGSNVFYDCENLKTITIENPDCIIGYDYDIPVDVNKPLIKAYKNSTAESFASYCGYEFQSTGAYMPKGKCGENVEWKIDGNGTLTISGSGDMYDFSDYTMRAEDGFPLLSGEFRFANYHASIRNIIIKNGVTSIGDNAFVICSNLKTVQIPDSVTSIGKNAFKLCKKLETADIPESVASIGEGAFKSCKNLKEINIPDKVECIGNETFYDCDSLTEIDIPDSVTSIGDDAFFSCNSLRKVEISKNVTQIGAGAFDGLDLLKEIEIPDSVTKLGDYAFANCRSLETVKVGKGVKEIGCCPFDNTIWFMNQKDADKQGFVIINNILIGSNNIKSTVAIPEKVKHIGNGAFAGCGEMSSTELQDNVESIGDKAYSGCSSLETITIRNPECVFGKDVFKDAYKRLTICGYKGSTAEKYALENEIRFVELYEAPPAVTTTKKPVVTTTTTKKTDVTTTTTKKPAVTTTTTKAPALKASVYGDANCDKIVDISDVISVKCYLLNSKKYSLSAQGLANSDVQETGNGINSNDAIVIQQYSLKLIDKLPV